LWGFGGEFEWIFVRAGDGDSGGDVLIGYIAVQSGFFQNLWRQEAALRSEAAGSDTFLFRQG